MKTKNEPGPVIVLQTLLTLYLLIEQLDDLATLSVFRMDLKRKANILLKELEWYVDRGIGKALEVDEQLTMDLLDQRKQLISKFATLNETEINTLAEMLNKLSLSKDKELCGKQ